MAIGTPATNFFLITRNFKRSYRLQETITYDFSEEGVVSTGESFKSKYDWSKLYKVKIIKDWMLIYHNHRSASMVKISLTDKKNIEELKQFLKANNFRTKLDW
jgi:hypothetical protein